MTCRLVRLITSLVARHLDPVVIRFGAIFEKSPAAAGRVCEPSEESKTSKFRRGPMGTWMAWANEDPSKLLCKRTCNF